MVAALELSKHYPTALITPRLPSADDPLRVEAVPAALLALLVEYGIHPRRVGVDRLHEARLIAWENNRFAESVGPVSAHVERPALDLALLDVLVASRRVQIILSGSALSLDDIDDLQRKGVRLIDATGRRSVLARKRVHPARPWAARTFLTSRQSCPAGGEFRIAALPGGFVYRLGAAEYLLLGLVVRGNTVTGDPAAVARYLHEYEADWILEDLPGLADMTPGRVWPASVQWTTGDIGTRIGDAALARDILSSQGLASGISEALYAAAIKDSAGETLLSLRQAEQRESHLRSLASLIARCRFRDHAAWREYAEFIEGNLAHQQPASSIALRAGQLHRLAAQTR